MTSSETRTQSTKSRKVDINDIIRDHDTLQVRAEIDPKAVESYARSMRAGSEFPPVAIYRVDGELFLVDGFHRVAAAEAAAEAAGTYRAEIAAQITDGTIGEAVAAAAVANTTNGKQLKRKEHRRSFQMLAEAGALNGMDSRSIAALMNHVVSHVTIWKWARMDFPGLLPEKPKKGEKPDRTIEREVDPMSVQQVEQRTVLSSLQQAHHLLCADKVVDQSTLDDAASLARDILEEAIKRGGDPERADDIY